MVIGFIGLGDVGSRFSSGISKFGGANVLGYDLKFGLEEFAEKEQRCIEHGVRFAAGTKELVEGSDIMIAATSCADAISTAAGALPFMREGQYYVDVNSAVPSVKRVIRDMVEEKGVHFVDGGIMDSPLNGWHRIPIVMSGEYAQHVVDTLNGYGMNIRNVGSDVGQASSLKILRSIFTKGVEALLIETFASAYEFGVQDEVFGSIETMLTSEEIRPMFARMVATDVVHAKRRAHEVGGVADMLAEMHMDNTMSKASYEKLMWSANSGVKEHFDGQTPEDYLQVVEYFAKLRNE